MPPIASLVMDQIPSVLHTATLGGVVSCLVRHFQASISSLPFLSRPLSVLNIGTWSPEVVAPESSDVVSVDLSDVTGCVGCRTTEAGDERRI